ncbi:MAG: hypothetical protein A2070_07240 [Bdellovibrionales bacterium GWC1_52_8]|nr:MAG: hypothetical protein A2Z97_08635 [Bdellovibrionales bacterium GWB1_52_6]OFZ02778.1 MAG: hypothetical protein A2X97_04185 [Bdellovibrionales bacterium GWA1_52_35]OFZ44141.1 MAG: hypothetical protein A2070_07240 [Bdellovibrionales bacterium GWC1_52_8]HCM38359.1 hypothetical protein [Bdellovibrionales bacterium]
MASGKNDSSRNSKAPTPARALWNTLARIQITQNYSDAQLAELLKMTQREFLAHKAGRKDISILSALSLSEHLHIGVEALFNGQIDYTSLTLHHGGQDHLLPERYALKAMSRMRSAKTFLNYVEERYGWQTRAMLLRKFQIKESALVNDDALVNVRLASDICSFVHRYTNDLQPIVDMGHHSFNTYSSSKVGALIRTQEGMRTVHEFVVSEILGKYIEANFIWAIETISNQGCTVSGYPNPDVPEVEEMHNPLMCALRTGFTSSVPRYLGFRNSSVRKTACIWQGDSRCRYEIQFPETASAHVIPFKKRAPELELR